LAVHSESNFASKISLNDLPTIAISRVTGPHWSPICCLKSGMSELDKDFLGSIPEIYDTYLVPLIFECYAQDLADRVSALKPDSVLETAAGSGVVARAMVSALPSGTQYVVTDLNQPMLDHAASKQGPDPRIKWRRADALDLPFDDASFEVVVCQFGVMFYPDRITGYSEAYRVLKPGGKLIFNVWDRIEANDFAYVVTAAAATVFPDDPPQFLPRTPHGYYDENLIREELRGVGFTEVSFVSLETISSAPSPRHPAIAYCQGTPLRNEIEERNADLLDHVTDCATEAISARYGTGPVAAKIRGHIITAAR
jgi:ubiquinone/menaquinone biosynthesis C-methylase UbiE